jgi:DNA modification methylase
MKPYFEEGGITIYHGDCREILPTLESVALVLTDPPYGIGEHGGACRTRGAPGYSKHKNLGWNKERPARDIFDLILVKSIAAVIWGGNYFADFLPPKMGWFYWEKLMGGDFSDGELAWTSRDGALRQFTKCPKGMNKLHPTEKPLELISWCLGFFPDAQTVLDPFMGSGTTLVAAKNLNGRAIGIEIEERYCEIAAKRLSQSVFPFGAAK